MHAPPFPDLRGRIGTRHSPVERPCAPLQRTPTLRSEGYHIPSAAQYLPRPAICVSGNSLKGCIRSVWQLLNAMACATAESKTGAQHERRALEALVEQEPRERRSLALEQHLHIAGRDPVARREAGERQFLTVQAVEDFRLNRIQACGAQAVAMP
jgi:hypothetical protein